MKYVWFKNEYSLMYYSKRDSIKQGELLTLKEIEKIGLNLENYKNENEIRFVNINPKHTYKVKFHKNDVSHRFID